MCTYLAKRGSTYYFRRAIPVELRPAFGGRAEFMLSLRSKDRAEAKLRIPAHTVETVAKSCMKPVASPGTFRSPTTLINTLTRSHVPVISQKAIRPIDQATDFALYSRIWVACRTLLALWSQNCSRQPRYSLPSASYLGSSPCCGLTSACPCHGHRQTVTSDIANSDSGLNKSRCFSVV